MNIVKYKLAILEDNLIIQKTLAGYFKKSPYFELKFVVASSEEFMAMAEHDIDLLLCDIGLPGKSGIEATRFIKRKQPDIQVVMFTVFEDREHILKALGAGASGYLLKNTPMDQIHQQLLEVMRGGGVMSPNVVRTVINHFNPFLDTMDIKDAARLTYREIEIVSMLRCGVPYKEMAENLFVSVDTVKYHVRNVYHKLQVNSRAELIKKF